MTVELKEYIERIIDEHEGRNMDRIRTLEKQVEALENLVDAKQRALALAVEKQEAAYDARFASVNEWRATYGDIVSKTVSRDMFNTKVEDTNRRLNNIEQRMANIDGRILGYASGVGMIVLIISIVSQLLNLGG